MMEDQLRGEDGEKTPGSDFAIDPETGYPIDPDTGEYTGSINVNSRICSISAVLRWKPLEELQELVNDPLPKTVQVIDFDRRKGVLSDNDVGEYLTDVYGLRHPCDLQLYTKERRNDILRAAREYGASIKQLARLTGIGEKIIRNSSGRKGS